jgi:L-threonylcarbamoyladenylate synthase
MIHIPYSDILKKENIHQIRETVEKNGIIIYPTDTLYALGGNFFSESVSRGIDRLKNRINLPYSVVVSGPGQMKGLVDIIPDIFLQLYEKLLPGKFTFLLPLSSSLKKPHLKNQTKIGIRIPDVPLMLELVAKLNVPLISTSVNRSGQKPLTHPGPIVKNFPGIDLIIDKGPMGPSHGSTVLDLTVSPVKCIRKGDDFQKLIQLGIFIASD